MTAQLDEGKDFSKRLKKIQESKEKMQYRLREVAEKERELLVLQRTKHDGVREREKDREVSPLQPKVKSELSEKDITLLKRLKHEQMKF